MKHNIRVHAYYTNQWKYESYKGVLLPWQDRHSLRVTVIASSCAMVMRATRSTRGFAESPTRWWAAGPSRPTANGGKLWWGIQGFHLVGRLWFLPTICNKTPHNYLQWETLNITGSFIVKDLVCLNHTSAYRTRETINGVNSSNYHNIKIISFVIRVSHDLQNEIKNSWHCKSISYKVPPTIEN